MNEKTDGSLAPLLLLLPLAAAIASCLLLQPTWEFEDFNATMWWLGAATGVSIALAVAADWRALCAGNDPELYFNRRSPRFWFVMTVLGPLFPVTYPLYFRARRKLGGANLFAAAILSELVYFTVTGLLLYQQCSNRRCS